MRRGLFIFLIATGFSNPQYISEPTLRDDLHVKFNSTLPAGSAIILLHQPHIVAAFLAGRRLTFLPDRKIWLGVAPIAPTYLFVQLRDATGAGFVEMPIQPVAEAMDSAMPLRLPSSVWERVSDKHQTQRKTDREKLWDMLNASADNFSGGCWEPPLRSKITSRFASARQLPNGINYYHTGEDLRAAKGTPIEAIGDGRVVFADEMVVPGNNVLIDHGRGWFSRYLHLSKINVRPGDLVHASTIVGLSGDTGRVEAPHLHWEIIWQGIPANPSLFLSEWSKYCSRAG